MDPLGHEEIQIDAAGFILVTGIIGILGLLDYGVGHFGSTPLYLGMMLLFAGTSYLLLLGNE